jgi:hypothetical protein
MSPWRRPKKSPDAEPGGAGDSTPEEQVDLLYDRADRLLTSEPGTPQSVEAAERAAEVAGVLTIGADTPDNQRRLARALWCSASAHTAAMDVPAAAESAKLCWAVCCQLLDATIKDPAAFDEVVWLVVLWSGTLGPALERAGQQQDAAQMSKICYDIAVGTQGPHARHARARIVMHQLAVRAEVFARAALDGRMDQIAANVQEDITLGRDALEVLREHATEGPYEMSEVARMLQVLSRLYLAAGLVDDIAPTLYEAVAVAATVANQGPVFSGLLHELQAERTALNSAAPNSTVLNSAALDSIGDQAAVLPTASSERAFLRAASDIGAGAGVLFPDDIAEAAAMVEGLQSQQAGPSGAPGVLGPLRGLAMAWYARLLVNAGRPAEASDLAGRAVRQLMQFSDAPDKIQAALTVALTVEVTARQAAGDDGRARSAQERAAAIRTLLVRRDSTYLDDLGPPSLG